MADDRYFDPDPPPRRSPRLRGDVGDLPSLPTARLRRSPPSRTALDRLARDLAIYLAIEGGMSLRMAAKIFGLTHVGVGKAYRRMVLRHKRV